MAITDEQLKQIIEAALMAADQTLTVDRLLALFEEEKEPPTKEQIRNALKEIGEECESRGVELKKVSSGYRFQAKQDHAKWISRLWEEKPARYSRALLETLVLIAYKQPITRGEIEHVRGVAVSTHIVKTLLERDWVKVVGHRDVPGKPALYATTKAFLDYFNMKSLEELPTLQEIRDLDKINEELNLVDPGAPKPEDSENVQQAEGDTSEATDQVVEAQTEETASEVDHGMDTDDTEDDAISAEGEAELEDEMEDPEIHDREPIIEHDIAVHEDAENDNVALQENDTETAIDEAVEDDTSEDLAAEADEGVDDTVEELEAITEQENDTETTIDEAVEDDTSEDLAAEADEGVDDTVEELEAITDEVIEEDEMEEIETVAGGVPAGKDLSKEEGEVLDDIEAAAVETIEEEQAVDIGDELASEETVDRSDNIVDQNEENEPRDILAASSEVAVEDVIADELQDESQFEESETSDVMLGEVVETEIEDVPQAEEIEASETRAEESIESAAGAAAKRNQIDDEEQAVSSVNESEDAVQDAPSNSSERETVTEMSDADTGSEYNNMGSKLESWK